MHREEAVSLNLFLGTAALFAAIAIATLLVSI